MLSRTPLRKPPITSCLGSVRPRIYACERRSDKHPRGHNYTVFSTVHDRMSPSFQKLVCFHTRQLRVAIKPCAIWGNDRDCVSCEHDNASLEHVERKKKKEKTSPSITTLKESKCPNRSSSEIKKKKETTHLRSVGRRKESVTQAKTKAYKGKRTPSQTITTHQLLHPRYRWKCSGPWHC